MKLSNIFVYFGLFLVLFGSSNGQSSSGKASSDKLSSGKSSSGKSSSSSDDGDKFVFSTTVFTHFKTDIIELISCVGCYGLTPSHPDVSVYDLQSVSANDKTMIPALIRLVFRDCGGIVPNLVALGENEFFTDGKYNGYAGGCNGCIGIDNSDNDNLLESAIDPVDDICWNYNMYISRADCWALAATIAVEYSAADLGAQQAPPFLQIISESVLEGDIPYYYGRNDCNNGYPSSGVDFPFSNPSDVTFSFPDALQGWTHIDEWFKSRFSWNNNKFSNRDIVSLISSGHSIGRSHERISGFSGAWDFSRDVIDNVFISSLFGEEYVNSLAIFGITQNWHQEIRNPNEEGSKAQWQISQPPNVIDQFGLDDPEVFDPPLLSLYLAFNTDFSLVYDISYYLENDMHESIDCISNAQAVCPSNETIITAPRSDNSKFTNFNLGKTSDELGEQTWCNYGETCCQYIQCPFQCEGGFNRYSKIIGDTTLLDGLNETSDCPAALAYRYNMQFKQDTRVENRLMGQDFAKAFLKMITIGYVDENDENNVLLKVVGDEDNC